MIEVLAFGLGMESNMRISQFVRCRHDEMGTFMVPVLFHDLVVCVLGVLGKLVMVHFLMRIVCDDFAPVGLLVWVGTVVERFEVNVGVGSDVGFGGGMFGCGRVGV